MSDQLKIFNAARKLLDQYSVGGSRTTLVDWMHVGWGRHKFFTSTDSVVAAYDWTDKNPDESDVAFMDGTIRSFKSGLAEPWALIAGQPPYLDPVQKESGAGQDRVSCRMARSRVNRRFRRRISGRRRYEKFSTRPNSILDFAA